MSFQTISHGAGTRVHIGSTEAYLVSPADHVGKIVSAVVILSDTAGPHTEYCIDFADKLAELQGYKVLIPDFHRENDKSRERSTLDQSRFLPIMSEAVSYLRKAEAIQKVSAIGFSSGATILMALTATPSTLDLDCCVCACPDAFPDSVLGSPSSSSCPMLCIGGEKDPAFQNIHIEALNAFIREKQGRIKSFKNQGQAFFYRDLVCEDAALQAIAEIIDWLSIHTQDFKLAAGTSDSNLWWPQGRNGPFLNCGLKHWHQCRAEWMINTGVSPRSVVR